MPKLSAEELREPDVKLEWRDGDLPREIYRELEAYGVTTNGVKNVVEIPGYKWREIESMMRQLEGR